MERAKEWKELRNVVVRQKLLFGMLLKVWNHLKMLKFFNLFKNKV